MIQIMLGREAWKWRNWLGEGVHGLSPDEDNGRLLLLERLNISVRDKLLNIAVRDKGLTRTNPSSQWWRRGPQWKRARLREESRYGHLTTGYYGRASGEGGRALSTKSHAQENGKNLCGYRPHDTLIFQWCAADWVLNYIDCVGCRAKLALWGEGTRVI